MAIRKNNDLICSRVREYIKVLKQNKVKIWRLYLYGSYANGTHNENSDIDLAIFLSKNNLDGFDEDMLLMRLRRKVDLRIEPHPLAKSDFDLTNPYITEIIKNGKRII